MKFVLLLLFSASLTTCDGNRSSSSLSVWGDANNKFSFDLFDEIIKKSDDEKNILFSPLSINFALSLALLGAEGDTKEQLQNALHVDSLRNNQDGTTRLIDDLKSSGSLKIANTLFVNEDVDVKDSYIEDADDIFGARPQMLDFSKNEKSRTIINDWVSRNTDNKITELVAPGQLNRKTDLVLANALHFASDWLNQFGYTRRERFYSGKKYKRVDMMSQREFFNYVDAPKLKSEIIELPYVDEQYSFNIILPNFNVDIKTVQEYLKLELVQEYVLKMASTAVDLKLPKFETSQKLSLR